MPEAPGDFTALYERIKKDVVPTADMIHDKSGNAFALVPGGYNVINLREIQFSDNAPAPDRIRQNVTVNTVPAFNAYWARFGADYSVVFANPKSRTVRAIFDYHQLESPRWGSHTCTLALAHSPEWVEWLGHNGKQVDQSTFAEFLEDNSPDITRPAAGAIQDVIRSMTFSTAIVFDSAVDTQSGNVQLTYHEETKATSGKTEKMVLPRVFEITIPVFQGCPMATLTARLRYRLNGGKLSLWYDLLRPDRVVDQMFQDIVAAIQEPLINPVIIGTEK